MARQETLFQAIAKSGVAAWEAEHGALTDDELNAATVRLRPGDIECDLDDDVLDDDDLTRHERPVGTGPLVERLHRPPVFRRFVPREAATSMSCSGDCITRWHGRRGRMQRSYAFPVEPPKWKRNAIFEKVVAGGLTPSDCELDGDERGWRLTHSPSDSYFRLESNAGHYTTTKTVGDLPPWTVDAYIWATVEERIEQWAGEVKRDVDTPDLWAELRRERQTLTGARHDDDENTRFTSEEQAEIAEQIQQIKAYMKTTYPVSEAQMLSLEARLDDVVAAAGRVGRMDWALMFCGVVLGFIVDNVVPQDAARDILVMAFKGLENLFGGWGGPPQLPSGP